MQIPAQIHKTSAFGIGGSPGLDEVPDGRLHGQPLFPVAGRGISVRMQRMLKGMVTVGEKSCIHPEAYRQPEEIEVVLGEIQHDRALGDCRKF